MSYKYQRYINNAVIQNCLRPQPKDWCAPITVAEVINVLLRNNMTPEKVAKIMNWTPAMIVGGKLGTQSVINGIRTLSKGKLHCKIISPKNLPQHWQQIKEHLQNPNKVLYYHEPGHHVLLCGFIEEPLIDESNVWDHQNLFRNDYNSRKNWVIKAEHNLKFPENIQQGMLIPIAFTKLCENIKEKRNSDLVLISKY